MSSHNIIVPATCTTFGRSTLHHRSPVPSTIVDRIIMNASNNIDEMLYIDTDVDPTVDESECGACHLRLVSGLYDTDDEHHLHEDEEDYDHHRHHQEQHHDVLLPHADNENDYDEPSLLSSTCSSSEMDSPSSMATIDDTVGVGGRYSNIEYEYHVDPYVLGVGHHGSVRKCIHRTSGEKYAVKSIRRSYPSRIKASGLAREIRMLRRVQKHRNIVRLADVYEDEDYVHIVTDLCEGGELFDKISEMSSKRSKGSPPCFTESNAARILYQILNAVSYLHEQGIVHRDIKPENILFETAEKDSPIKVVDFGLSRTHYGSHEPPMRAIVGTPYYIAPEVLRKNYTKSCDVWSVGIIAYILLCGYPPFNGSNNNETHEAILRGKYCFPREEWQYISSEAVDFIIRMLQIDPSRRMTAVQALNHPWIIKHLSNEMMSGEYDGLDHSSVEVVYSERHPRRKPSSPSLIPGSSSGNSPARTQRKVQMSMFGL